MQNLKLWLLQNISDLQFHHVLICIFFSLHLDNCARTLWCNSFPKHWLLVRVIAIGNISCSLTYCPSCQGIEVTSKLIRRSKDFSSWWKASKYPYCTHLIHYLESITSWHHRFYKFHISISAITIDHEIPNKYIEHVIYRHWKQYALQSLYLMWNMGHIIHIIMNVRVIIL
jgi:hypothetical protein